MSSPKASTKSCRPASHEGRPQRDFDIVIYSTGFDTTHFLGPMTMKGLPAAT